MAQALVINQDVAPTTGAWIETGFDGAVYTANAVAPTTGAWIETTPR